VTRRVQHVHQHIARYEALSVSERAEVEGDFAFVALVQAVGCARAACQLRSAGVVVRMHVGIDDMRDAHARALRLLEEPVLIARHDVHGHGFRMARAAE